MRKTMTVLLSVVMTLGVCGPVFADPDPEKAGDFDPVLGSWYLDQEFYKVADDYMVQQSLDETRSVNGSGGLVFTFEEDGTAHEMIFDNTDSRDISAEWEAVSPDVYHYTDEYGLEMEFQYDAGEGMLHRYEFGDEKNADSPDRDFVYVRAVTGSWQLDRVLQITEEPDEAQIILPKEENQSLYAEEETIYTFDADGNGIETIQDGPDIAEKGFIWKQAEPDAYAFFIPEEDEISVPDKVFSYLREDDTLYRDIVTEDPDAAYRHLRFIYERVKPADDQEEISQSDWTQIEMPETPSIELPVYSEEPAEEASEEPSEEAPEEESQFSGEVADAPILTPEL